jgi:hypothetical protein
MLQPFYMSADFKQKTQIREPIVTQYDDLIFVVTVFDNGDPAIIDDLSYKFVSRRPDNKSYYVNGVKTGDNEITFDLGKTEVSLIGKVNAAIQLFDSNNQRLSSFTFNYTVTEDISLSEDLSSQELTLLEYVVQEGPGLVDYFKETKPLIEEFTDYVNDLNQKANQSDLNVTNANVSANTTAISANANAIANMGNSSPKATYATLSALQTALPTGATGIYLVTADGGWYYWNNTAWVKGGTYQSTGISTDSITPKMVKFLTKSSNLLNRKTVTSGLLDYTTGNVTASINDVVSDFIEAFPNMYYASYPSGQFAFYDSNKTFISGVTNTLYSTNRKSPANTAYIRFGLTLTNFNALDSNGKYQQQIQVSSTVFNTFPAYEDFYIKFGTLTLLTDNLTSDVLSYIFNNISDGIVSPKKTNFLKYSSNLFNRNNVTNGTLDYTTGTVTPSDDYVTDFSPVDANTYIASYPSGNIAYYDANKKYISGVTNTLYTTNRKTPSNAAYFRFSTISTNYNWQDISGAKLQINVSPTVFTALPPYEDYGLKFNGEKMLTTSDKQMYTGVPQTIVNIVQETIAIGKNTPKIDANASIAIGTGALQNLQTATSAGDDGKFNTSVGHNSMNKTTTGDHNTAVGWSAMADNTTGDGNTAVGEDALLHNQIGSANVAIGNRAMQAATGDRNTAIGGAAMYYGSGVPSGTGNTAVGYGAGPDDGNGNYNVAIGYWTKNGYNLNNNVAIGNNVNNTKSNQVVIGNAQTTENIFHGSLVMYDRITGNPYFISVQNGQLVLTPYVGV